MANPNLINVSSVLGANAGFNLTNTATATLITVASDKLVKINTLLCCFIYDLRPLFHIIITS